jgi:photosystem II stability/assembly factor-like uncharacterized protein
MGFNIMPLKLWNSARLWLPLLALGISTAIAVLQPVRNSGRNEGGWLNWWLYPVVSDPHTGSTRMSADLHAIYALPSKSRWNVWVAGNAGLLGFSPDSGATWQKLPQIPFPSQDAQDIVGLYFRDEKNGWLVTRSDHTYDTNNGGWTWTSGAEHHHNLLSASRHCDSHAMVTTRNDLLVRGSALGSMPRTLNELNTMMTDRKDLQVRGIALGSKSRIDEQHIPGIYRVFLLSPTATAVGSNRQMWHLVDNEWRPEQIRVSTESTATAAQDYPQDYPEDLRGVFDSDTGIWVCGTSGSIYYRNAGDNLWTKQVSQTTNALNDIFFGNPKEGWAVGDGGTVLHTVDGGKNWAFQTQGSLTQLPPAYVAPWYYLTWLLCLAPLAWPATARRQDDGSAPFLLPDTPIRNLADDAVPFQPLVKNLIRILRNTATCPPQIIVLNGVSGTGRTTLLNLLRSALAGSALTTVWLNASHHQNDTDILTTMLESVHAQAVPPVWSIRGLRFYLTLFRKRAAAVFVAAMLTAVVAAAALGAILRAESVAHVSVLAVAAGTLWATYLKLSAFPLRPGKLLGAIRGAAGDLARQSGGRYRIEEDMRRFSDAVGARMTLLIDDLDRCSPEKIVKMFEAFDSLASGMSCFVIVALDVSRVHAQGVKPGEDPLRSPVREWFQKTVNLTLPIPLPEVSSVARLAQPAPNAGTRAPVTRMGAADYLAATAVFILLLYGAVRLGSLVEGRVQVVKRVQGWYGTLRPSGNRQEPGRRPPVAQDEKTSTDSIHKEPHAGDERTFIPVSHPGQTAAIVPPGRIGTRLPWQSLIGLFAVACVLIRQNTYRLAVTTPDPSGTLDAALNRSAVPIHLVCRTPRAIKRFVNRVRLLAGLRQEVEGANAIPDDLLIALAALDEVRKQGRANEIPEFCLSLFPAGLDEGALSSYGKVFGKLNNLNFAQRFEDFGKVS